VISEGFTGTDFSGEEDDNEGDMAYSLNNRLPLISLTVLSADRQGSQAPGDEMICHQALEMSLPDKAYKIITPE
jgi:hypothetical protein